MFLLLTKKKLADNHTGFLQLTMECLLIPGAYSKLQRVDYMASSSSF